METYFATRVDAAMAGLLAIENSLKLADGYVAYEPAEFRLLDALEAIGLLARAEGLDVDRLFERATNLRARRSEHLLPRPPRAIITIALPTSTDRWLGALARANSVTADSMLGEIARAFADFAGRRPQGPEATAAASLHVALDYEFIPEVDAFNELVEADSAELRESMQQREVAANA